MAIFLSAAKPRALQEELLEGGYAPETPCAVVYRASWPDEVVIECRLEDLADRVREAGFTRQALDTGRPWARGGWDALSPLQPAVLAHVPPGEACGEGRDAAT